MPQALYILLTHRQSDLAAETVTKNLFSITPILTVFFPGSGVVSETQAQLTCLKALSETTASEDTKSSTDENKKSVAGRLERSLVFGAIGMVTVLFVLLLA